MFRLLVVVPCYNEQESLPSLLDELHAARTRLQAVAHLEIVVIDDGSEDRTAQIAQQAKVRVVRLSDNLGIGGAVQTGIRLALREGFDGAIQVDGDGQHPPAEIEKLVEALHVAERPDLIIGSRFLERVGFQSTFMRRIGIRWLSWLLRVTVRMKILDPASGFRLFGPRALQLFEKTYPYDYPEPESLALARLAKLRVVEVPVRMQARQGGASSIFGLKSIYYVVKVTLAVILTLSRNARPIVGHRS